MEAATTTSEPENLVEVVPAVGDVFIYEHAGDTFTRTVTAIEEREDFGYYRLISVSST